MEAEIQEINLFNIEMLKKYLMISLDTKHAAGMGISQIYIKLNVA